VRYPFGSDFVAIATGALSHKRFGAAARAVPLRRNPNVGNAPSGNDVNAYVRCFPPRGGRWAPFIARSAPNGCNDGRPTRDCEIGEHVRFHTMVVAWER
jgi:hypothetical protein